MSITFNGTEIKTINYNNTELSKVTFNSTVVYEQGPSTYTVTTGTMSRGYVTYKGVTYKDKRTFTVSAGEYITLVSESSGVSHTIKINGVTVKSDSDGMYNISYSYAVNSNVRIDSTQSGVTLRTV